MSTFGIVRRPGSAVLLAGVTALALWGFADRADAAAVKVAIRKDVLTVTGTPGADAITLRLRIGDPNTLEVDVGGDGTADFIFDRRRFSAIRVDGAAGNDTLIADRLGGVFTDTELTTFDGGDGNDVLRGENGNETLIGGAGDDLVDGNVGADIIALGDGADVVQWDPGDGSDTINGGGGADRLQFNGANIGETYRLLASAGHVRLSRDIGNVILDLDDLEGVDLRTLGGADSVTVENLSGTDLTELRTDLAAVGGGDDLQIDTVVVAPGVVIGQNGTDAVVDGLGARVRVVNGAVTDRIQVTGPSAADVVTVAGSANADTVAVIADGTDVVVQGATPGVHVRLTGVELLDVDLAAGNDQFSVVGNVVSLVTLDVDGGDGDDTLLGGNGADVLRGGAGDDLLDGNQGADSVFGGDGADIFQWDPGDTSDTVNGGAGADRLLFYGANIGETYGISAAADHVRLTRDIAAVVMDLDDIESVDLRTLGGADSVTVGNLSGTDLTELRTDLAAAGGGDDLQIDTIAVAPGVTIGQDGSAAVVDGLGARVRVVNGAATDRIHATGVSAADVISVAGSAGADTVSVFADGTDVTVFGATPGVHVRLTGVELLDVDLAAGSDQFSVAGNVASLVTLDVDGGDGDDTLLGGNGADVLRGGAGDDLVDGNQGADTIFLGDGNDVVQWDPGDSSDTINGGAGADRLQFNGASVGEKFGLSAAAGHVRLTRDIAAVVLDLDDVEIVDLRAAGGADTVTVDDLTSTDLTELRTDLGIVGGGGDGLADTVTVNGTSGDDAVVVNADGSTVVVQGLKAAVRIANADPTLDRLIVNGLAGTDSVTATPQAGALIVLDLVP